MAVKIEDVSHSAADYNTVRWVPNRNCMCLLIVLLELPFQCVNGHTFILLDKLPNVFCSSWKGDVIPVVSVNKLFILQTTIPMVVSIIYLLKVKGGHHSILETLLSLRW